VDKGLTWERVTEHAAWEVRSGHTSLIDSHDAIYVIGGFVGESGLFTEQQVWKSIDYGANWNLLETTGLVKRGDHASVIDRSNHLITIGGAVEIRGVINDFLVSNDGITWNDISFDDPKFSGRSQHSAVIEKNAGGYESIYVIAGANSNNDAMNDVWKTSTGNNNWMKIGGDEGIDGLSPRYGHTSLIDGDNNIYVIGGRQNNGNFFNDVLKLEKDGVQWTSQTSNAPWVRRADHTTVMDSAGNFYLMGGYSYSSGVYSLNDVWKSEDKGRSWVRLW